MSSTDCVDIIENLVYEYVKPLGFRKHERTLHRFFTITEPLKKYYYEYECNIRTRLGSLVDGKDSFYDLKKFKKNSNGCY